VTIPASAIQSGPKGPFTYVINDKSQVDMRPITVTQTENNVALIGTGLKVGETVVTMGQFRLQPGSKVRIADQLADAGPALTDAPEGTGPAQ
jgi:multidrug efflux system membrane fusion protein